ncbi:Protein of uncharacterised function (DUF3710) [Actinomyces bovis]|uniref:Protein of uncharacterized function (DUF3710) n=1 Tax=Actinomyces bovis TaxID=1658 RepID=A0ABY1VLR9_9ACTO|nr:DUF3710 domain-containing protein [Actinomyces bovis]SPT52437.1 Protein of uncharacterised function (DUF3710) [Actinomyces bovis]VEG54084.1 Protein of uncharacterised function (DUF3710) [Actinomyces israelii]
MALFSRRRDKDEASSAKDQTEPQGEQRNSAEQESAKGPWDSRDFSEDEVTRIDLGSLRIPVVDGMQLRFEAAQPGADIAAVSLVLGGSLMSLRVMAAPRSESLWDEVRQELTAMITEQGGDVTVADGNFGRELKTVVIAVDQSGKQARHDLRLVGWDGPRWMLRADFLGPAATSAEAAEALEEVLSGIVVHRDDVPRPPREALPIHPPGQAPGPEAEDLPGLDPLAPGPTIAEVR